jgi:excisionase family DNA binding protein
MVNGKNLVKQQISGYLTTQELAKILGISRVAVHKRIKKGEINATKIGRNYVIAKDELPIIFGSVLSEATKTAIEDAVRKTVKDYGEALRLLGKE